MKADACLLCGRAGPGQTVLDDVTDRRYGVPGRYEYRRCEGCGLVVLHPWPEDHAAGYPSAYSQHRATVAVGAGSTPLRRRVRQDVLAASGYGEPNPAGTVLRAIPPVRVAALGGFLLVPPAKPDGDRGRLLDFGSGNGRFLATMSQLGWEAYGVERDAQSAAVARSAADVTVVADLDDGGFPDGYFDVVTMNHVVEHLDDPIATLRELHRVLAPNGLLGVACPNWSALSRRLWGRAWYALEAPRHTVHFTVPTLRAAVAAAGFTVESATSRSVREGPESWRKSWLYRYGRPAPRAVVVGGTAISAVAALAGAGEEIELWARPWPGGRPVTR